MVCNCTLSILFCIPRLLFELRMGTTLADRIRKVIADSGLSLPSFSARCGVSKSALTYYRDGTRLPQADFLQALCNGFNVNPAWLLMGWGEPYAEVTDATAELLYIHPAVQIVEVAVQEAGIELNERQKEAIVQLVKEEMNKQAKGVAKRFVHVLTGEDRNNG